MYKQDSENIRPEQEEVYLGYICKEPLSITQKNVEQTFVGGWPEWLYSPQGVQELICDRCDTKRMKCKKQQQKHSPVQQKKTQQIPKQLQSSETVNQTKLKDQDKDKQQVEQSKQNNHVAMTFLMQIYCPLDSERTYHRVLYLFYCHRCRRNYTVFRQQAPKSWQLTEDCKQSTQIFNKQFVKVLCENSFKVQTDEVSKKQLQKIVNSSKLEVEEQTIQQADFEDSGQDEDYNQKDYLNQKQDKKLTERLQRSENDTSQQTVLPEHPSLNFAKDPLFETYRKVLLKLQYPLLIYSSCNVPVLYNSEPLNPRHRCQKCGMGVKLQVQVTQQMLSAIEGCMGLVGMDWGSLFVYTCVASCTPSNQQLSKSKKGQKQNSIEEIMVVQYELDAIKDQDVGKVKKKSKRRKRQKAKKNKSRSKSLSQSENQQNQEQPQQQKLEIKKAIINNNTHERPNISKTNHQGDWD